jgi:hypothetical protein
MGGGIRAKERELEMHLVKRNWSDAMMTIIVWKCLQQMGSAITLPVVQCLGSW